MNFVTSRPGSLPVVLCGLAALVLCAPRAEAQPAISFDVATSGATYGLRDRIPVTLTIANTTEPAPDQGAGAVPTSAQIDAANTAQNLRVTRVLLTGTDIYGNPVTIATTSYPAPTVNVNDLGFGVPSDIGDVGPGNSQTRTIEIVIPNDGTLHDLTDPGYSVTVTIDWVVPPPPAGGPAGTGTRTGSSSANSLIGVSPNLELPSVTCQPNPTIFRGGEVVRFNSIIRNSLTGDGTREGRPMRTVAADRFRLVTHLTTDPGYGSNTPNDDDYQLFFTDIFGDLGDFPAPDGQSEIRVIRVLNTPGAIPSYGNPDPALGALPNTTSRNYTPQPDDGFLDIGEVLNIEYDVLVPQNFPGTYFIAGMVDSLSQIDEPLGFNPPRESPPREATALVNDNTFLDPTATKFVIDSTGLDNSPDVGIVSGAVSESTGAVTTVANNDSDQPAVSGQGEVVAFVSYATNLASDGGKTNGRRHIYAQIQDPQNGALSTVVVSKSTRGTLGNGDSFNPMVSADGRFVVFESNATNLVPGDTNGQTDIFVRDLLLNVTTRVSLNSAGLQAAGSSLQPSISDNGRFVAFHSNARNLAANPTATRLWGSYQIFVVDRDKDNDEIFDESGATATYLASVNPLNRPANAYTHFARISGDGKFLAYISHATNLDGATAALWYSSVYRVPLRNGSPVIADLELVSRASGLAGAPADDSSYEISINRDGNHVAFSSLADNLVANDTNGVSDIFVRDLSKATPKTVRVSVSSERAATGIITVLGSVGPAPADNVPTDNVIAGNSVAFGAARVPPLAPLIFGGAALNPAVGPEATDSRDNLTTSINAVLGVLTNLGIAAESSTPVLPLTGFTVSPTSYNPSIFLISLSPGAAGNEAITVSPSMLATPMAGGGTEANDPAVAVVGVPFGSSMPSISADGRFVAFRTVATNLDVYRPAPLENPLQPPRTLLRNGERIRPLLNGAGNAYVHDRQLDGDSDFDTAGNFGSTRVSVSKFGYRTTALLNTPSSANSHAPSISANGQYIAFASDAENNGGILFGRTNLQPLDNNGYRDVFLYNRRFAGTEQEAPRRRQTIAFGALPSPRFGNVSSIKLDAVASSALPVTYTSSDPSVATVKGNTISVVGAGTSIITAKQAGDSSWAPATQTRELTVRKGTQAIAFKKSFRAGEGYLLPSFPPKKSSAGLTVKYRSANPRVAQVLSGNVIKIVGSGYTTITATQPGNRNWEAAKPVKQRVGSPKTRRR
jgi:Tol biopolymer transport system component